MFIMSIVAAEPVYNMTYNDVKVIMMYDKDAEIAIQMYAKDYDSCIRSYFVLFPPNKGETEAQKMQLIENYLLNVSTNDKKFKSMQLIFLAIYQNLRIADNNGHVEMPLEKYTEYVARIDKTTYPAVMRFYLKQYFNYYVNNQIKNTK